MSLYICDLCWENATEKGDVYCPACRTQYGNDTDRLDRMAQHKDLLRTIVHDATRKGVREELERVLKTESNIAIRRAAGDLYIKATEGETK